MNKKLVYNYLFITFLFSYSLWGILIILTKFFDMKLDNFLCITLYLLGSFGPLVGSYILKKKNNSITGFKDFLKKLFDFKTDVFSYLLVLFFLILYFIYPFIIGRITFDIPIYIAILLHCSFNAFQMAFVFEENILISTCVTLIMMIGSLSIYNFKMVKKS